MEVILRYLQQILSTPAIFVGLIDNQNNPRLYRLGRGRGRRSAVNRSVRRPVPNGVRHARRRSEQRSN